MDLFYIDNVDSTMNEYNLEDFCRTCGKCFQKGASMNSLDNIISEKGLGNLLKFFIDFELEVTKNTALPRQICEKCFLHIKFIWKFYENCKTAQDRLFNLFKISEESLIKYEIRENKMKEEIELDDPENREVQIYEIKYIDEEEDEEVEEVEEIEEVEEVEEEEKCLIEIEEVKALENSSLNYSNEENFEKTDEKKIVEQNSSTKKKKNKTDIEKNLILCECGQDFPNKTELRKHKHKEHKKQERYVCDICGTSYKVRNAFEGHISRHKGEIPYKCDLCGKSFTQKGALRRHISIHTGVKSYQCDVCGKQFIHYSSFKMHKLVHGDIRNVKCETCGLLLRSSSHLSRHKLVHTGLKPHACPKCGQRFAQRYNMTSHIKSHHQGIRRQKKPKKTNSENDSNLIGQHIEQNTTIINNEIK